MGKGNIHVVPEIADAAEHWLPRGVEVLSRQTHGGAVILEIAGNAIEDGVGYQLVVTESPLSRTVELVKNPFQPTDAQPTYSELATEVAKMDPDGDGHIGGARKRKKKPTDG